MRAYAVTTSGSTLCCHWCKVPLGNATKVNYLNGNMPVCDLCVMRVHGPAIPPFHDWHSTVEDEARDNR